jgi:hypothetical protein
MQTGIACHVAGRVLRVQDAYTDTGSRPPLPTYAAHAAVRQHQRPRVNRKLAALPHHARRQPRRRARVAADVDAAGGGGRRGLRQSHGRRRRVGSCTDPISRWPLTR